MSHDYEAAVRVALLSCPPAQPYLEFMLYFPDGYDKHYKLDEYAIKAYRGLKDRDIMAEKAIEYFQGIGQSYENIHLVFV